MGSVGLRSSRSVNVVLARLLLLNICIGVGAVAMTQNALATERQDSCQGQDEISGDVTCYINCEVYACLAGCLTNPSMGCGLMCFAENVGCTATCSIIEFPEP